MLMPSDRVPPYVKWLAGGVAGSFLLSISVCWTLMQTHASGASPHSGTASKGEVDKLENRIESRLSRIEDKLDRLLEKSSEN